MKTRKIDPNLWRDVATELFKRIETMMLTLPSKPEAKGKFLVASTQNTLDRVQQWRNEIHPTARGFGLLAKKLYVEFKTVKTDFPDWS